jgi:hypothetical protein
MKRSFSEVDFHEFSWIFHAKCLIAQGEIKPSSWTCAFGRGMAGGPEMNFRP